MSCETLHGVFFNALKQFSDNVAVLYFDGKVKPIKLTYEQLANDCYKLTKCIQNTGATGFIGVCVDKDISFPAIILGILHSGLPFVCIDPSYSKENVCYLLKYLNINWIISNENCSFAKVDFSVIGNKVTLCDLNEDKYVIWNVSSHLSVHENQNIFSKSLNLAYAIQTSGSTGTPKIIRVPHHCIVPNVIDISEQLDVQSDDVIFLGSPSTFDPSIIELFLPFSMGAALLITSSSVKASPPLLLDILFPKSDELFSGISILQITPSTFTRWTSFDIKTQILSNTTSLKKLILGGEPCPSITVLNNWREEKNRTDIFNIYGITEISCWATLEKIKYFSSVELDVETCSSEVPLGSPLSETQLQVRDQKGQEIFNGEGELYIGSGSRICLVNQEVKGELTSPVFRATGDIVKFDIERNCLQFIGRKNRVIKRWGHQICLTKMEKTLSAHPDVRTCCCVWNQPTCILAAVVSWNIEDESKSLRKYCIAHLHRAAVPDMLITTKEVPLTAHGKIDYEALQFLVLENKEMKTVKQDDLIMLPSRLLNVWEKVLGKEALSTDTFVSCGGNSLLAMQLSSELEQFYGEKIRNSFLSSLFSNCSFKDIEENLLSFLHNYRPSNMDASIVATSKAYENMIDLSADGNENEKNQHMQKEIVNIAIHNKRRKLASNFVSLEAEKDSVRSETGKLKKDITSSICENKLISVYCRGKVVLNKQREEKITYFSSKMTSLKLNWKFNLFKCIDASPTCLKFLRNKWVTVGSHSHFLVVLDCASGEVISKCELPDRIESSVCPSACGKYGVVGCYDGCVYCICLIDGSIKWCFRTGDIVKSSPSLCIENTTIAIGSYDSNLYCITLEEGKLMWKTSASTGSIYSSPCVSKDGHIFYGTLDGLCVALTEVTGAIVWKKGVSSPVFCSPALLVSFNAIVFAEVVGLVHCFSVKDGSTLWTFKTNGNIFSSINSLYFTLHSYELLLFGCHDKNIYCLKLEKDNDVCLVWKKELDSAVFATPFMFPVENSFSQLLVNHTELSVKSTFVVAASTKGNLYIIDLELGYIKLCSTLTHEIFSSPIVCDGAVYVGCRDDFLYCFTILGDELIQ